VRKAGFFPVDCYRNSLNMREMEIFDCVLKKTAPKGDLSGGGHILHLCRESPAQQ
jgi:hypothetical protein